MKEAALINGMILFIIIAANFFTYVLGSTNVASGLQNLVSRACRAWGDHPIINVIVLILGCFIDPITITLLTVPIFLPVVKSLGFDPIWFGVMFCVNTQIGLITPPMGTDLFAVQDDLQHPDRARSSRAWRPSWCCLLRPPGGHRRLPGDRAVSAERDDRQVTLLQTEQVVIRLAPRRRSSLAPRGGARPGRGK